MEHSCNYPWSLSHPPEGPLAPYIDSFTELLHNQGYAQRSAHASTKLIADFSQWLEHNGIALQETIADHITCYLQYRKRHRRPRSDDAFTLKKFLDLLHHAGVIAEEKDLPKESPTQHLMDQYESYLREERMLVTVTIDYYLLFIRLFLTEYFSDNEEPQLSQLCAADIVGFVQVQAKRLHLKRAKVLTTALRSFFRFARYRGDIKIDLAAAVPAVANWSMTSIPRSISPDHVQAVLASCNRQTAVGCRDYAILLLLARLGLRASEIVELSLEDIDWRAGLLKVSGKRGAKCPLPVPFEVGEAIVAYLQNARPHSTSRRVFLRVKAPIEGFKGPSAISCLVRHALERAGIDLPNKGAHQFRHGLACELLRQDATLAEIGELLRHRSPNTTAIYAKVDLKALRPLGLPWPGGVQ